MKHVDISLGLDDDTPAWPGTRPFHLEWYKRLEKGNCTNNSCLVGDTHVGTHIDAPLHFVNEGKSVDQLDLDILIGPAMVAFLPELEAVTGKDLARLGLPRDVRRLLLRTRNSELWSRDVKEFRRDYVALTADAARWLVDEEIHLIGVDYLSVQQYEDGPEVHKILLKAEIVVVEGLNLAGVEPGRYELLCLPLKLIGAEGAPARAVLRRL